MPPDTEIRVHLSARLSAAQLHDLAATLVGPSGIKRVDFEISAGNEVKIKSERPLLPDSYYTLLLAVDPPKPEASGGALDSSRQGVTGSEPSNTASGGKPEVIAIVAWRTQALDVRSGAQAPADQIGSDGRKDDRHDGEVFHPRQDQYGGRWMTDNRYPHSRDLSALAQEQQDILDRLPQPARDRLQARMQQTGEYVPPEIVDLAHPEGEVVRPAPARAGSLANGMASVSGQVLRLNGKPLADVTLSIGTQKTQTDAYGEFTLADVKAGEQVLVINGQHAHRSRAPLPGPGHGQDASASGLVDQDGVDFGRYEYRVNLVAGPNELTHTIWLTRIDHAHEVAIASPTKQDITITHPDIPGLKLHIPAGAVIRGADGQLVRAISITPIPVDQMPFPMPYTDVSVYYTIQPGGAHIESVDGKPLAATLDYPNYTTQPPGAKQALFDYDPEGRGWYVYAQGVVSKDGKRIIPPQPFKIYQFAMTSYASSGGGPGGPGPSCGGAGAGGGGGGDGPGGGGSGTGAGGNTGAGGDGNGGGPGSDSSGDPVACNAGLFNESNVDLYVRDITPIAVERDYRQSDATQHAFGIGTSDPYDEYLYFETPGAYTADAIDLVLGNGVAVKFVPLIPGSTDYYTGAVFVSNDLGPFYGARLALTAPYQNFVVTTKAGNRYAFTYYQSRLSWTEDRYGNRTSIMRDASGRVIRVVSPNGRWVEFQYNSSTCATCITQATDHTGRYVQYGYDNLGQLQTVNAPEGVSTTYGWDNTAHEILTVKDARSNLEVTNQYYSGTGNTALDGRVKKQTYNDGSYRSFAYFFDASNQITASEVTDQRGVVRRREYDSNRYIVRDVMAKGTTKQQVWTFDRDPTTHLVLLQTDPLGRQTKFDYDDVGNLTQRTYLYGTALATSWRTTYEPLYSQIQTSTDPLGNTTTRNYDSMGNLTEIDDPLGHKATFTYYPNGQLQTATLWPGTPSSDTQLTTTWSYLYGDLVQVVDPMSRTTKFNVDALGRVISVVDPAGHVLNITYDGQDRVTQRCDQLNHCANFKYDGNSNLLQFTRGTTERDFTYDAMNRLYTEGRSSGQTPAVEDTYTYDPVTESQTRTEASGRVSVTSYDELWRPSQVTVGLGSPMTVTRTLTFGYDGGSRLTSIADSVSGTLTYTYDDRFDAVASETGPTGSVSYVYQANGQLQSATPSGGTAISYGYDAADRLRTITQSAGSGAAQPGTALNIDLTYDNADRRSTLTLANGIVLTYGWDNDGELTGMTWAQGSTTLGNLVYGYDVLGRRNSLTGSFARLNLPPALNVTVGSDGRVATENGSTLSYDQNGRLTQDASYKYVWNDLGQLSELHKASDNSLLASYKYDAVGRRIQQTIGGVTTRVLYNGANPIQLQNASGSPTTNLLAGGIDEWYAATSGGSTEHFLTDALGSTIRLTDASGAKLVDYTYDAYGGSTNDNAAISNGFQYTGRQNDGNGLYFYRARYYRPSVGRFISQDPIGLAGGDSLYGYTSNDPLRYRDPKGQDVAGAIGGAIIGGVTGGLGAALAGGNGWDIAGGIVGGAAGGAVAGGLGGGLTGAVAGAGGDLFGQVFANWRNHKGMHCINWGEVVGAGVGGFIGAAGSDFIGEGLMSRGWGGITSSVVANTITSGPALGLGLIGNKINGEAKGCDCE